MPRSKSNEIKLCLNKTKSGINSDNINSHAKINLLKNKAQLLAYQESLSTPSLIQTGKALPVIPVACKEPSSSASVGVFIHAGGLYGEEIMRMPYSLSLG